MAKAAFNAGVIPIALFAQSANPANQPLSEPKCRSAACEEHIDRPATFWFVLAQHTYSPRTRIGL